MRELCDEFDALLIFDEVQTGCGLTGTALGLPAIGRRARCGRLRQEDAGVRHHGRPAASTRSRDNVFAVSSRINSTWGGNLVDMVRSRRILEIIESDGLMVRAAKAGRYLLDRLEELAAEFPGLVLDVRGRGLMCAFSLPSGAERDELIRRLWDRRVIMLASGPDSVRFRPALTVSRDEIDDAVAAVRGRAQLDSVGSDGRQRRIVDRSRGSSERPTSSQPCSSASLRAAGVNSWLVTTMVLVQSCIGAPATTS